jgi:hypothetical protein
MVGVPATIPELLEETEKNLEDSSVGYSVSLLNPNRTPPAYSSVGFCYGVRVRCVYMYKSVLLALRSQTAYIFTNITAVAYKERFL